jgi:ABC-type multidrug transport system permease subunit
MKRGVFTVLLLAVLLLPSLSFAKGVPLFFQTGDELFEIEGAPAFEDGFSLGYACERFALFGADIWTWKCELMAVNVGEFSAGDLGDELKTEYSKVYSLSDRKRNVWNHYGIFLLVAVVIGGIAIKARE